MKMSEEIKNMLHEKTTKKERVSVESTNKNLGGEKKKK
jgi:hypothetical protein